MGSYLTWLIVVSLTIAVGSVCLTILLALWMLVKSVFGRR